MRLLFALSLVWSASAQLKLVSNTQGCDYNSPVEMYLEHESATMPTLKACQDSCLSSPTCVSITYYFDKFCSHFASECENLRYQERGAQTFSKIKVDCSTLRRIQKNDFECGDVIPPALRQIAVGKKCSAKGQTSYMPKFSKTQPTLSKCMESCQANVACMGFTYFADCFCSHFSVMCDEPTEDAPFSVSYKYDAPRPKPPTKLWDSVAPSMACKKEEVEYIAATSGKQETAQHCKVACECSPGCVAVTFWRDQWCSHYSKFCKIQTEFGRGVSSFVLASGARRYLRG